MHTISVTLSCFVSGWALSHLTVCAVQAQGVIGSAAGEPREVEAVPAISVTLGCLPGTELRAVRVDDSNLPDGGDSDWSY